MDPRVTKHLKDDMVFLKFFIMLTEWRQFNVDINGKREDCYCTWQQLSFVLNFLENTFRKELDPHRYIDYIEDFYDHLDSEIKKHLERHLDISELMFEKHKLKQDYQGIVSLYKEVYEMLHFASFEKDLKKDHDCKEFGQLKYAYLQKIGQNLKLYQNYTKDFLESKMKTSTLV